MSFDEDLSAYLVEFGSDATINGEVVRGIFDAAYAEQFGVAGSSPAFLVPTASIPVVALADIVVLGTANYAVVGIHPDGTGMTNLILQVA